jgi:hypothetical protein
MKIHIFVVTTCIPERGEKPCLPSVFGTEAKAIEYLEEMLQEEWRSHAEWNEEGTELLPYPGNWQEANDALAKFYSDGSWGQWQLTSHEVDLGNLAIVLDGGLVECAVADGPLVGGDIVVIDYDTEGADDDELTEVPQGSGMVADAIVGYRDIGRAAITIPANE